MNYTENYHLPQWVKTDRIMMDDFNAAMANLESGITEAQATADTLPYVVGSYTGAGNAQTIRVGFKPSLVLIFTFQSAVNYLDASGKVFLAGETVNSQFVTMVEDGFQLSAHDSRLEYTYYNQSGRVFQYIAFH